MNAAQSNLDIVGLGLACLDVLIRLDTMPTWERGGGFEQMTFDGGGPVGTAIVAAARLGARCGFVGTAGDDEAARLKLQSFHDEGVDLSHLITFPGPEAKLMICYVNQKTGDRVFSACRSGKHQCLDFCHLDRKYMTSAQYLHLDACHGDIAITAAQWMKEAGKTVVLDAGGGDFTKRIIPFIDVLIVSEGSLRALAADQPLDRAGPAVLKMGPRIVVETQGAHGSHTFVDGEAFHTPAFPVDVIDTTGAGDVFHGAFIVGLLHNWPLRFVCQFASAVSALKCTKLGGRRGCPTFDATMAFLKDRGVQLP